MATFLGTLLIGYAGYSAHRQFSRFQERAAMAEMKGNAASIAEAERAYFEEWGKYTDHLEDAGFNPTGEKRSSIYTRSADVPTALLNSVRPDLLPMVGKESFRFLYLFKDAYGTASLAVLSEHGFVVIADEAESGSAPERMPNCSDVKTSFIEITLPGQDNH